MNETSVLSATVKFKLLRHFALGGMLTLAGCAVSPSRPAARPAEQPLAHLTVVTPDAQHDLLAQLLAGEMALAGNKLPAAARYYSQAMQLTDDPRVAQRAATLAIATHDTSAARHALARWQTLGASAADLAQARAEAALGQGDTADARVQLQRLLGAGGKDAWRRFGRALLGARDPAQAAQLLEDLATPERLPADAQAWLAMSELGERLGRQAYAQRIAEAAAERFGSAETYTWAARIRSKAGDPAGARTLLRKALAKSPDDTHLRLAYAGMLNREGDPAGAAKFLQRGPQDADTYALRAALAAQAHDKKAIAALYGQMQHATDAIRRPSAFLLGQLAEMLDRKGEALDWYSQVDEDDPHAFDADLRSALVLYAQGHHQQAHGLLEQLQTGYLDEPEALRRAYEADAQLYLGEADFTQAERAFGRALQVAPDDLALLYGRGLAYAEAGKTDLAIRDLRHLLKLKPHDVQASNALGYILADANRDLGQASQLIQMARKAKPHDPAIIDSWGWLQYRLGHLDQALTALRDAWKAGKDADVGVHLGEVLWQRGERQDALQIFDQVRRLDPHNRALQATLKRLRP